MCTTLTPFIYWKLRVSIKGRAHPKKKKKCEGFENFITLKQFVKCYKAIDSPLSSMIYLQQIYWERGGRGGALPPCRGDHQCHNKCMNLPKTKTDANDRAIPKHWHIVNASFWTNLMPHMSNSQCRLFWNLKDPVLVQTLSYRRKITYDLSLIGFFHRLIPMQDVGHNMLHLHVAQQLPWLYMHQWVISPTNWQWCWAEQTISIWHWSK